MIKYLKIEISDVFYLIPINSIITVESGDASAYLDIYEQEKALSIYNKLIGLTSDNINYLLIYNFVIFVYSTFFSNL